MKQLVDDLTLNSRFTRQWYWTGMLASRAAAAPVNTQCHDEVTSDSL